MKLGTMIVLWASLGCFWARGEEGFDSLFNGRDLSGWQRATNAYAVDSATQVLYSKPPSGGYLYTQAVYSNFVFRFEFKLTKGANNGIGVRCPDQGFASREGMEFQILDNTDPKYAKIGETHLHGSLYGCVPAKGVELKPIGEWNSEEIRAVDNKVRVTVNGKVVLDTDLDQAQSVDGIPRTGFKRRWGYLGLLSHGDRVDFRNLFVKRLP